MSFRQLLLRNLLFHWRTNVAVICGVIAATAVIGGALVVGDSVRESLRDMSLERLGQIDHALATGRFFREELAGELQQAAAQQRLVVAPLLAMQGTLERDRAANDVTRAGQVQVYAVDERAWSLLEHGPLDVPQAGQIVLNRRVADQLQVKAGEQISLYIEVPSAIPRDSLLGERNDAPVELVATVTGIAEEELGLARLGLNPTQQLPANAFVALNDLQSLLELQAVPRSRTNPIPKPARVNSLFIGSTGSLSPDPRQIAPEAAAEWTQKLGRLLKLEDLALRLRDDSSRGYVTLESEQMFLESTISSAALTAARELNLETSPVLVYLINEIWKPETPDKWSMYSVVAGIDPTAEAPFGPFEFVGEHQPLAGNAAWLNDWVADDLGAKVGDTVKVKYHVVGDRGGLPEEELELRVAGIVKLAGPANDTQYTPTVPGVTDVTSYDQWNNPFPLKREKITSRDDDYLADYRTTPKVFVSLDFAQQTWQSRYGNLTTVRVAVRNEESVDVLQQQFSAKLLEKLSPRDLGLAILPVKAQGLAAAQGTTDFTGLFIGFSFFLILSATLLVGLLFRLGIEQRLSEVGLLSAVGLTPGQVRTLLLTEGGLLVGIGGALGAGAAVGYAAVMIHGLKTWWIGAIGTRFLFLHVTPVSLFAGSAIAVIVALVAVWWALRRTKGLSTRTLLTGDVSESTNLKRPWLARLLAAIAIGGSLLLAVLTIAGIIPDVEAFGGFSWRVVMFFLVGMGMLTGTLAALSTALGSNSALPISASGTAGRAQLGWRNAARNRSRSVMTASLLASAAFVIVAVAAGQQNPTGMTPDRRSGNGGFTLVAETNVPLLADLNTGEGRGKLGFDLTDSKTVALLDAARVYPFRVQPGENASCLNLYQTQLPTVLGVPDDVLRTFIDDNRFLFADTPGEHPWSLLQEELPEGRVPVLGDMNTLMYSLHKGIGATIGVPNEEHPEHTLEVRGMFANSIFQGVLVMSETNFKRVFPQQAGYRYFLIEVDPAQADEASSLLESKLGVYGFDADSVAQRLADFLAVQNTYLSTFQTLGGLGLLLGTLGLATVMLRNVLERRGEFALLRAVGFRQGQVAWLVVMENAFLLTCGLLSGSLAALLAMGPHLLTSGANVPWTSLIVLLLSVFAVGMLAAVVAVRAAVATPILATLRGE